MSLCGDLKETSGLIASLGDGIGEFWLFSDRLLTGERELGEGELDSCTEGDLRLAGVIDLLRLGSGNLRRTGDIDWRRGVEGDRRCRLLTGDGDLR